jgi:hypothetical protein
MEISTQHPTFSSEYSIWPSTEVQNPPLVSTCFQFSQQKLNVYVLTLLKDWAGPMTGDSL